MGKGREVTEENGLKKVKKGSEKHLLDHLNSVRPIKFTMESEEDSKLPFLDCLLKRESDGMLTSTVYRKPTHTDIPPQGKRLELPVVTYLYRTFHVFTNLSCTG